MLYVNSNPLKNTRKDGTVFWTVLVGVASAVLKEYGLTEAPTKVTMNIRENEIGLYTKALAEAKSTGVKLVLRGDKTVLTTPKDNVWTDDQGVVRHDTQASAWVENGILDVLQNETKVSDRLAKLLG